MAVTKEESTSAVTRPYDGGDFYRNSVPLCNCSAWKTLRRLWERCRSRSRHRLREFREPIENHRDHAACRVTHGADESNVPPSGEGYKVHLKAPDSSEWFHAGLRFTAVPSRLLKWTTHPRAPRRPKKSAASSTSGSSTASARRDCTRSCVAARSNSVTFIQTAS